MNTTAIDRLRQADEMLRQMKMLAARQILSELIRQSQDVGAQISGALRIIHHSFYEHYDEAASVLATAIQKGYPHDPNVLSAYSFACFALGRFQVCIRAGRELLKVNPQNWNAMRTVGMAHLAVSEPLDAYLNFSAAMLVAPRESGLVGFRNLALRLLAGDRIATVNMDGQNLKFYLRVNNGQMIEAAIHHIHGQLTEQEESVS
jgi:Flp pilus assembly protein TadD